MLVYLEAGGSQSVTRRPAESVRMAVYAESSADSGGVEIRVERKADGALAVLVNRFETANGGAGHWRPMARFGVPTRSRRLEDSDGG